MSLALLEKLIDEDFGYSYTGRWGKSKDHSSLVVDRESETWFWNSRDLKGKVKDYLTIVRNYSEQQAIALIKNMVAGEVFATEDNQTSAPYEKLVNILWNNGKSEREYWYHRGLSDATIDRFRLGFVDGWYTIPIFVDGVFRNFQCRRDKPEKTIRPWYRGVGPLIFNSDVLKYVTSVYITEGPVDAIKLNQEGFTAVSHTGGAGGWNQEWFSKFIRVKEIIYIADNDEAGIAGAKKVAKSLGENRVKILRFSDKPLKYDSVDFFRDGGTVDEFKERVKYSKYLCEGV